MCALRKLINFLPLLWHERQRLFLFLLSFDFFVLIFDNPIQLRSIAWILKWTLRLFIYSPHDPQWLSTDDHQALYSPFSPIEAAASCFYARWKSRSKTLSKPKISHDLTFSLYFSSSHDLVHHRRASISLKNPPNRIIPIYPLLLVYFSSFFGHQHCHHSTLVP